MPRPQQLSLKMSRPVLSRRILSLVGDFLIVPDLYPFKLQLMEDLQLSSESGEGYGSIPLSLEITFDPSSNPKTTVSFGTTESSTLKSSDIPMESEQE